MKAVMKLGAWECAGIGTLGLLALVSIAAASARFAVTEQEEIARDAAVQAAVRTKPRAVEAPAHAATAPSPDPAPQVPVKFARISPPVRDMKQGESDRNVHTPPLAASANLLAVGGRARVDERQYVVLLRADAGFEKWRAAFARGDVPLKDLISAGAVTSVPRGASVHILAIEGGLARVEVDGLNWQGWVRTKHLVTEQ